MSDVKDLLPFPVRIIEREATSVVWFDRISEIERHFELSEPLNADEIEQVVKIARDGVVHACICPFSEDVHDIRSLMADASAEHLDRDYCERCDDI